MRASKRQLWTVIFFYKIQQEEQFTRQKSTEERFDRKVDVTAPIWLSSTSRRKEEPIAVTSPLSK